MPMPPRNDYSDLATILQATVNPLVAKLQVLENKVDSLNQDRVTRTDLEKLRAEIVGSYVPRDTYEVRHTSLIERNIQLEKDLEELRKEHKADIEAIENRLESGKERIWSRVLQGLSIISVLIVIGSWIAEHVHF